MTDDEYNRGKTEAGMQALKSSVGRAHTRIDRHDGRLTAIERIMYTGMGVLLFIKLFPNVMPWISG